MKKWTEEELELSITLLKNGKDYTYIGDVLNRTAKSIKVKLQKEGECVSKYNNDTIIVCLNCGGEIQISSNNKSQSNRKFCSSSCSATYNNNKRHIDTYKKTSTSLKKYNNNDIQTDILHKCLNCENIVKRREYVYCSTKCQNQYYYNNYIIDWKNGKNDGTIKGGTLSKHIRKYIFDKYEHKCAECGWDKINKHTGKKPLEIDHIDGDSSNNIEDNLILICPNCHSLTPTYKGANKGKGRINRMKKYYKEKLNIVKPIVIVKPIIQKLCECGEEITKNAKMCIDCSKSKQRKVKERPPYDQLNKEIEETNYSSVGRKYGVSATTIKNWIKQYNKIK